MASLCASAVKQFNYKYELLVHHETAFSILVVDAHWLHNRSVSVVFVVIVCSAEWHSTRINAGFTALFFPKFREYRPVPHTAPNMQQ